MAQAAAAQDLSQEELHAPEQAEQGAKAPEKGELGKALESGNKENVVSIFKKDATAAKEAISRLDVAKDDVNPAFLTEVPAAKSLVEGVKAANDNAMKKTEEAEGLAMEQVSIAMGEMGPAANEAPPKPVEAEFTPEEVEKFEAAAAKLETPQVMEAVPAPIEVPKPVETPAVKNEMAEQQKLEAEESMKEDLDALEAFAKEHGLHLDGDLNAQPKELENLTTTERKYVEVLQAKYRAGHASEAHAEALIAVAAETDPTKKKALAQQAFELSGTAKAMEIGATVMNAQYMALPEILALTAGNPTGGSYGGQAFEQPPAGAGPTGPMGPEGPKGPDLTLINGGKRPIGGTGEPLYNDRTYGKPPGITIVTPVKSEGPGEKVPPSAVDNWFSRNFRALGGFFGGGDSKDRH